MEPTDAALTVTRGADGISWRSGCVHESVLRYSPGGTRKPAPVCAGQGRLAHSRPSSHEFWYMWFIRQKFWKKFLTSSRCGFPIRVRPQIRIGAFTKSVNRRILYIDDTTSRLSRRPFRKVEPKSYPHQSSRSFNSSSKVAPRDRTLHAQRGCNLCNLGATFEQSGSLMQSSNERSWHRTQFVPLQDGLEKRQVGRC